MRAADRRALFVGARGYEAAGGIILRDLFEQDDGGWLQDPALLTAMVTEKLKREAEDPIAEGWKWIAVAVDFPYGSTSDLRRLTGETEALSEEQCATRNSLCEKYDRLEEQYAEAEALPGDIEQRLSMAERDRDRAGGIRKSSGSLQSFRHRPGWRIRSIDRDGGLDRARLVRPEDDAPITPTSTLVGAEGKQDEACDTSPQAIRRTVISIGADAESEDSEDDTINPLPDRLVTELTAYRTLALQDAVASNPPVALPALLYTLWCAPKGAITLWVKVPPGQWSVGPVAGRRFGWVTGRIEALRQRPPWAAERTGGP